MTADEIRKAAYDPDGPPVNFTAEVAAQLAELNEKLQDLIATSLGVELVKK
jgi:hypothetical protein